MGRFRLTPQEDYVFGVSLRGDRLVFGPAGGEIVRFVLLVPIAVFVAFGFAATEDGALAWLVPTAIGVGALGYGVTVLRARVVATPDGVAVRRFVHTRLVPWSAIDRIVVEDVRRGVSFGRRAEVGAVAFLRLADRTSVRLPGFVSAAEREPMALGGATVTRTKVDALLRYREESVPR